MITIKRDGTIKLSKYDTDGMMVAKWARVSLDAPVVRIQFMPLSGAGAVNVKEYIRHYHLLDAGFCSQVDIRGKFESTQENETTLLIHLDRRG